MIDLETIVQENTVKLKEITGPSGVYMNSEIAQILIAYYRLNYPDVIIDELIEKILNGKHYDDFREIKNEEQIIEFVGNLFGIGHPDNPRLAKFSGEPVAGIIYLAIIRVNADILNRKYTRYFNDGNSATYDIKFNNMNDEYPFNILSLYDVDSGFTVLGDAWPISSVSMDDVVQYRLISKE
jgi:hypothetical protein